MKNYVLYKLDTDFYSDYLLCLNYESILNYLDQIQSEQVVKQKEGVLLIDQLLVAGNGKNRFITCKYSNGKIDLSSAQNVMPEYEIKSLTTNILKQHFDKLTSSILTESQRNMIKEGYVI